MEGSGWIEAKNLEVGSHLRDIKGGFVEVSALPERLGDVHVYNFTVDVAHNYYVSDERVLVHNCGNNTNERINRDSAYEAFLLVNTAGDTLSQALHGQTGPLPASVNFLNSMTAYANGGLKGAQATDLWVPNGASKVFNISSLSYAVEGAGEALHIAQALGANVPNSMLRIALGAGCIADASQSLSYWNKGNNFKSLKTAIIK